MTSSLTQKSSSNLFWLIKACLFRWLLISSPFFNHMSVGIRLYCLYVVLSVCILFAFLTFLSNPLCISSKLNTENRGISFKDKRPFDRWNTSLLQIYWVTNGNSKYECQGPASRYLIHNCIWYTLNWNAYIYWLPKCFLKRYY